MPEIEDRPISPNGLPSFPSAPEIPAVVPVVDSVTITVVVDSFHQALAKADTINGVQIARFGFDISPDRPPRRALYGEFGLSLILTTRISGENRRILVDFGYTPEAIINNLDILGVSTTQLDAMVLSHGHWDHFGGLVGMLDHHRDNIPVGTPLYLGGLECFCQRAISTTGTANQFGQLDHTALQASPLDVYYAERPAVVGDHAFTTGHIRSASFETILKPTQMAPTFAASLERFDPLEVEASWIPDQFDHELSTCVCVDGKGLVVTTSCGHRGIVNSIRRAQAVSGESRVHAVVGGFHLQPKDYDYVSKTVDELAEVDPDVIIPMHCTGNVFSDLVKDRLPDKLISSYVGSSFTFGAAK